MNKRNGQQPQLDTKQPALARKTSSEETEKNYGPHANEYLDFVSVPQEGKQHQTKTQKENTQLVDEGRNPIGISNLRKTAIHLDYIFV